MLRIGGTDVQLVQFMDYPNSADPQGGHYLICNFPLARLADANDKEIFTGQIIVRINTTITAAAQAILSRLLLGYQGYFVMIVNGTYTLPDQYAEIQADSVPWMNVQPTYALSSAYAKAAKTQFVPVAP
jgi:hypothetical protein